MWGQELSDRSRRSQISHDRQASNLGDFADAGPPAAPSQATKLSQLLGNECFAAFEKR
jgi:hypothetical protein